MGNRLHSRCSVLGMLCLAGLLSPACLRSPEAKRAKYLETGKKLLQNNDPSRAILQFRNAVQATPKNAEAYYQLGLAFLTAGDAINGVRAHRRAIELNPKHTAVQLRLAQLMAMVPHPDTLKDAQQRLLALLQSAPGGPEALHTLALTELKLGEPKDAMEHLARAMAAAPQNVSIALTLAEVKLQQNDLKAGRGDLEAGARESAKFGRWGGDLG
jgi:cytochrome c-type biogenesis protein CcmH/NrfG